MNLNIDYIKKSILIILGYVVFGRLGLLFAVPPGFATPIFPPAGIALGALLILGIKYWPSVLLGSFLMNLSISIHPEMSSTVLINSSIIGFLIGIGATLQALFACFLVRRYCGKSLKFIDLKQTLTFIFLVGPIACIVNASLGNLILYKFGLFTNEQFFVGCLTWWIGDVVGAVIFSLVGLMLFDKSNPSWVKRRRLVLTPTLIIFISVSCLFAYSNIYENQKIKDQFSLESSKHMKDFKFELERIQIRLEDISKMTYYTHKLDLKSFQDFAQETKNIQNIEAVIWSDIITGSDRARVEREIKESFYKSFFIKKRDAATQGLVVAPKQKYYNFIHYIHPVDDFLEILGLDLSSKINHLNIGKGIVGPFDFNKDNKSFKAFYLYQFVNNPLNKQGHVIFLINEDNLFNSYFSTEQNMFQVSIRSNEQVIFSNLNELNRNTKRLKITDQIKVLNQTWKIEIYPSNNYMKNIDTFISITILFLGLIFTIVAMIFFIIVSANIYENEELIVENTKINDILESSPDAMIVVNELGEIILANSQTTRLFGYLKEELIGKKVELLIPNRYKENHPKLRENFHKNPSFRSMGSNRDLYGKHKSGSDIPVEVSLSPIKTNEGLLVSSSIREVASRK